MRLKSVAVVGLIVPALLNPVVAHAEIGGSVIGPGGCDYPAVGYFGTAVNAVWYICATPVEENGTHWATLYGGWGTQGQGSATAGGMGIGLSINLGGQGGSSLFLWPDGTPGPMPNPPGTWKSRLVPSPAPVEHRTNKIEPYMQEAAVPGQVTPDVPPPPKTFEPEENPAGQQFVPSPPPNQTDPGNTNPEQQLPH